MKDQITLTKSNRMSAAEKKCFDLLKSWGYHRFSLICTLLQLIFSEDEMDNPSFCKTKLLGLIEKRAGGVPVMEAVSATSVPDQPKPADQSSRRSALAEYRSGREKEQKNTDLDPRDFLKGFNLQNGINDSH